MNKSHLQKSSLRFKQWSRKAYAAFKSVGRHVTIGSLKNVVADALLGKQKNSYNIYFIAWEKGNDYCSNEWNEQPPEELPETFILPTIPTKKIYYRNVKNTISVNLYSGLKAVSIKRFQLFLFAHHNKNQINKIKFRMNKQVITAWALLLTGTIATAQTDTTTEQLDPVTVTSSLIEKRSSETGRSISIITGETISKLPVNSIDELLKYVPGVEIQARGPRGAQSDISMRGGTFQQVLVILDGLRLNDPNTGHFNTYIPITPAEIDRIEILKGASSAIYGSDAIGGVINIITKAFNAKRQNKTKSIGGQVAVGEYGLVNTEVGGFYQHNNFSIGGGLLSNHATGVQQRGTRGFFHNTSASLGINYHISPAWNLSYRTSYDYRHFAAQNFYTASTLDTATEKITGWWHQARVGYEKGNNKFTLDAGYKNLDDYYSFFPGFAPNDNNTKLFQSLLTYRRYISAGTSVVGGINFHNKKIVSTDRGNHSLNTIAPFISAMQKIGNHFSLMPSMRVEIIDDLNAEWVPNLTASYKLKNLQLRASGGKTIRDADFTERYNNYGKASIPALNRVGNPWLTMERSWGYETGFDLFLRKGIKFSSTFFQRFNTDLIDWTQTAYADMQRKANLITDANYFLAKNIATLNTTGWETDVQAAPALGGNQSLLLSAGFLWQYSKSSEAQPSFYISSHAKFLTNFSVQYTVGRIAVGVNGIYKKRQPQLAQPIAAHISKDYFLLNGKASFDVMQNKLGVFVQADNIFNRNYSDLLGAQMPGRWLQGGIIFQMF